MSLIIPGRKPVKKQRPLPSSPIQWDKNKGKRITCSRCGKGSAKGVSPLVKVRDGEYVHVGCMKV